MELLLAIIFSLVHIPLLPPLNTLPINENKAVVTVIDATIYAYNSEVGQTDNDPFMTASMTMVRNGIIANNCLAFGTVVLIDGEPFEVMDRMNSRYGCEVFDIWMEERADAINFGKQFKKISVLKNRLR